MKKVVLIFISFLLCLSVEAQIKKGGYQIGVGGLPIIYPNGLPSGYSLRANLGYFPMDNLSVGILPFVGKVSDMSSQGANVYLRYYLSSNNFSFFVEGGAGLGRLEYETLSVYNGIMSSLNLGPGIHYKFENNLSIEFLVQYARLRNTTFPESTTIGNTFIPTIGFQYFIEK